MKQPKHIPFNVPLVTGGEEALMHKVLQGRYFAGDGPFTKSVQQQLSALSGVQKVLLTTSCTHALEMAALLCNIGPGDEVIMPSFTFVSTANAFVLRGARVVYVDIDPQTLNIAPKAVEAAITENTRAVVVMHYAGIACDMDAFVRICQEQQLYLIEDAAHGIDAYYKEQQLGTFGHLGALSFHHTKNVHCGEGGALLINDPKLQARAQVIRDKGTNRQDFLEGRVEEYTWVDLGSSYLLNEISAAFLSAQLEQLPQITAKRLECWQRYADGLAPLAEKGLLQLPFVPEGCRHNGHLFYILVNHAIMRPALMGFLAEKGVDAYFHYLPLHLSKAGRKTGRFFGTDVHTTEQSARLLRLPLYVGLELELIDQIVEWILAFYEGGGQ